MSQLTPLHILSLFNDMLQWWQVLLILVLIGLIVAWVYIRKNQQ